MTYEQRPESPFHRIRGDFRHSLSDSAKVDECLAVADEMLATLATLKREDAQRLIKLIRDLLDTVEPRIERSA